MMDQHPRPDPNSGSSTGFRPTPRQVVVAVAAVLLLIFILANFESAEVSFVVTTVTLPLGIVLIVTTLLGMAIGATLGVRRTKRRYRNDD
ncbi:MAG: DUF1049 domain-containing protein [Acidobacteria bacterium]|nr:DUF1049 domain-containing protein [Acidobacteriota bacterium]